MVENIYLHIFTIELRKTAMLYLVRIKQRSLFYLHRKSYTIVKMHIVK